MSRLGFISNTFLSEASRLPPAVFILLITIFSFGWLLGYGIYEGDQLIYLPDILKKIDPTLFPGDILFGPGGFTLFDEFIVAAIQYTGLDIFYVFFLLSFVIRFIYFYSIYRIALYFTGSKTASFLAPLIFLSGFVIYGTGMRTIAPMLLPKYVAIALSLLGFSFLFEKKVIFAALSMGLGFLFHPSGPLPFLAVFYVYLLSGGREIFTWKNAVSFLVPPLFLFWLYLFLPLVEGVGLLGTIDEAWRQVVLRRDSYYFLGTWYYPNSAPIYLAASIFLFFLVKKELAFIFEDRRKRKFLFLCFFVPPGLALLSFFLSDLAGFAVITQLSLGRSLMLWKFFFNGLFVYYALRYIPFNPRDFLYNFFLWGVVIAFVLNEKIAPIFLPALIFAWTARSISWPRFEAMISFLRKPAVAFFVLAITALIVSYVAFIHENEGFFEAFKIVVPLALLGATLNLSASVRSWFSRHWLVLITIILFWGAITVPSRLSIYPSALAKDSFVEACEWVKGNTDKSSLFLTEPFSGYGGEVRLLCMRGLFTTRRDGGQVVFSREYALEWNRRYDIIKRLESAYDSKFLFEVAEKYHIDYVFSDEPLEDLNRVFDNGSFYIYKLR